MGRGCMERLFVQLLFSDVNTDIRAATPISIAFVSWSFIADSNVFNRCSILIEETNTEITHSGTVDEGSTDDVLTFLQGQPARQAVVLDHAAVARKNYGFFAVQPPHGCGVGAYRHPDVLHVFGTFDDRDSPEQYTVYLFLQARGKAKQLHIEEFAFECVPG